MRVSTPPPLYTECYICVLYINLLFSSILSQAKSFVSILFYSPIDNRFSEFLSREGNERTTLRLMPTDLNPNWGAKFKGKCFANLNYCLHSSIGEDKRAYEHLKIGHHTHARTHSNYTHRQTFTSHTHTHTLEHTHVFAFNAGELKNCGLLHEPWNHNRLQALAPPDGHSRVAKFVVDVKHLRLDGRLTNTLPVRVRHLLDSQYVMKTYRHGDRYPEVFSQSSAASCRSKRFLISGTSATWRWHLRS